ncbi:hypothetical protein ACX8Z9_03425 [Arthrobacter halodurans]|uniref:Transposase DDE domain-containing protein n=1 Tax=Arthrobacter halodurans TaxID=516699 RepID=A0ABV4UMF7_9MICC
MKRRIRCWFRDSHNRVVVAQRIAQRAKYLLSPKDTRDEKGAYRMSSPARGPYPTLSCDLRPAKATKPRKTGLGMPRFRALTPVIEPPAQPDRICTNASGASFPATAGAKYAQKLQYKSDAWQKMYGPNRNTIEGSNAHLKDAAHEDLENPGRRRVRGFAKQLLLPMLSVVSANLRKIRKWQQEQTSVPAPNPDDSPKLTGERRAARTQPVEDPCPSSTTSRNTFNRKARKSRPSPRDDRLFHSHFGRFANTAYRVSQTSLGARGGT